MNINWSEKPEGFPIWIEDLHPEVFADGSGWHRDDGDRYTDQDGMHWAKPAEDDYRVHVAPSDEPMSAKSVLENMTEQDYKIIALEATVAQQAKMIEHLRGGLGNEPQLVSYAEDMSTCTLTTGDGIGYFYNRVDPDQSTGYTAVDMANAARDGFRDGAASHWQAMDTCPKHVDVLFFHARNGVIAGRLTDADSFMSDKERDEFDGSEEEQFAIDAFGFGHWGVDRMEGTEAPTHWMPYPPEPEVKP